MSMLRGVARVVTGSTYLVLGLDVLRDVGARPEVAAKSLAAIRRVVPLPPDDASVVRANAAVQVGAGAMLAVGVLPRLSAVALVGSLVPTTLAGHAFWAVEDPVARKQQQVQFVKNVAMLGGLLYAVAGGPRKARTS